MKKTTGWLKQLARWAVSEREREKEHTVAVWQVAIFDPNFRFVNSTISALIACLPMLKLVGLITQFEVLYWEENVLPHSVESEHEILGRWLSLRATNKWRNQKVKRKLRKRKLVLHPQKREQKKVNAFLLHTNIPA